MADNQDDNQRSLNVGQRSGHRHSRRQSPGCGAVEPSRALDYQQRAFQLNCALIDVRQIGTYSTGSGSP